MNKLFKSITLLLIVLIILGVVVWGTTSYNGPARDSDITYYSYKVVNTFPHDTNAFTEGLFYADGFLFEGTGLNGASSIRQVNLTSGKIILEKNLSQDFFGEGIALVDDLIVQLTWISKIGFLYNKTSFTLLGNFTYPTEGWGLTFDGNNLIMSDGSDRLYFLDKKTFQQVKQINVVSGNTSLMNLNELEYINGEIYANIWQQPKIAIINPETGKVRAYIDLTMLQNPPISNPEAVLNGIAYDIDKQRLFITGKFWPNIYEIQLISPK